MAYSLIIAQAAEDDIRQAFFWYEDKKEQLGTTFEQHITHAIASIQDNPLKNQVRYGGTRVFFLKKFPFGIHFKVTGNDILIVAVFHTSLSPDKWKKR